MIQCGNVPQHENKESKFCVMLFYCVDLKLPISTINHRITRTARILRHRLKINLQPVSQFMFLLLFRMIWWKKLDKFLVIGTVKLFACTRVRNMQNLNGRLDLYQ